MARAHKQIELTPDDFDAGDDRFAADNVVRRALTVEIQKLPKRAFERVRERKHLQREDRDIAIAARADQSRGSGIANDDRQERLARRLREKGQTTGGVVDATDYQNYMARLAYDIEHNDDFTRRTQRTREFFSLVGARNTPKPLVSALYDRFASMSVPEWRTLFKRYVEANAAEQCPPDELLTNFFRHGHPDVALDVETAYDVLLMMTDQRHEYTRRAAVFEGMPRYAYVLQQRRNDTAATDGVAAIENWMLPGDLSVFCRSFLPPELAQKGIEPTRRRTRAGRSVPCYHDMAMDVPARNALSKLCAGIPDDANTAEKRAYRVVRGTAIRALAFARSQHGLADATAAVAEGDVPLPPIPPAPVAARPRARKRKQARTGIENGAK